MIEDCEGKMPEDRNGRTLNPAPSRRELIAAGTVAIASLVFDGTRAVAQKKMEEPQSTGPDRARTSLHQEVSFKATPHRIYAILLDSKQFTAFSGEPAEISRDAGGVFSLFGGKIVGRNIELVPDQRIVQSWRPGSWAAGEYTLVRFVLKSEGEKTTAVLDHWGFHEGDFGHFDSGWRSHYWEPLTKYLG